MKSSRSKDTRRKQKKEVPPQDLTRQQTKDILEEEMDGLSLLLKAGLEEVIENESSIELNSRACLNEKIEFQVLQSKVDSLVETLNRYKQENFSIRSEFHEKLNILEKSLVKLQSTFEESKRSQDQNLSSHFKSIEEIYSILNKIQKEEKASNVNQLNEDFFKKLFSEQLDKINQGIDKKLFSLKEEIKEEIKELKTDMCEVKTEIKELKAEIKELKEDMCEVKAEIKELKEDMCEVKTEIKELKEDMCEVKAEIKELKEDMWEIKTEITELKEDVSEIKTEIKEKTSKFEHVLKDKFDNLRLFQIDLTIHFKSMSRKYDDFIGYAQDLINILLQTIPNSSS